MYYWQFTHGCKFVCFAKQQGTDVRTMGNCHIPTVLLTSALAAAQNSAQRLLATRPEQLTEDEKRMVNDKAFGKAMLVTREFTKTVCYERVVEWSEHAHVPQ